MPAEDIQYSDRYQDGIYEYRHVILPPDLTRIVPRTHLLSETEWRNLGVQQSPGWVHYLLHTPEPHVLLFRRLKPKEEEADVKPVVSSSESQSQQLSQQSQAAPSENSQATSTTSTNAVVCG